MGGQYSVHFKVLASSGDEHFITLRYNYYGGWYCVLVDLEGIHEAHKPMFAPDKFEFEVGPDAYKLLLGEGDKYYSLLRVVNGALVEVPNMMSQPVRQNAPQIEILVLDYEFDPKSLQDADPVAVYKVRVSLGDAQPYLIMRRFKEMAELNDNICSAFNGNVLYDNLPAFPTRIPKLLADHTDPVFLRDRCETMNEYFARLPRVPFVLDNPDFQGFLRPDA